MDSSKNKRGNENNTVEYNGGIMKTTVAEPIKEEEAAKKMDIDAPSAVAECNGGLSPNAEEQTNQLEDDVDEIDLVGSETSEIGKFEMSANAAEEVTIKSVPSEAAATTNKVKLPVDIIDNSSSTDIMQGETANEVENEAAPQLSGFARNLTARKILSAFVFNEPREIFFLIKWHGVRKPELVANAEVKEHIPLMLIDQYFSSIKEIKYSFLENLKHDIQKEQSFL